MSLIANSHRSTRATVARKCCRFQQHNGKIQRLKLSVKLPVSSVLLTSEICYKRPFFFLRPVPLRSEADRRRLHICCCRSSFPSRGCQFTWPTIQALIGRYSNIPEQYPTLPSRGRCWLVLISLMRTPLSKRQTQTHNCVCSTFSLVF